MPTLNQIAGLPQAPANPFTGMSDALERARLGYAQRKNSEQLQATANASAIQQTNNAIASEAARIDREFQQQSAREAMSFEAEQAQLNRDFQQSSAREAMAFEASQAQKQIDYQTEMSNTAYQRAVADLKAAGLNPALAYQQGGAAATAGAMASGVTASGSSASGKQASGSKASTDMRSVVDMLETVATNAKDERVALYHVFGNILGSSLGVVGKLG